MTKQLSPTVNVNEMPEIAGKLRLRQNKEHKQRKLNLEQNMAYRNKFDTLTHKNEFDTWFQLKHKELVHYTAITRSIKIMLKQSVFKAFKKKKNKKACLKNAFMLNRLLLCRCKGKIVVKFFCKKHLVNIFQKCFQTHLCSWFCLRKQRKHFVQLIINYDVISPPWRVKFLQVN